MQASMKILLVDDDVELLDMLGDYLTQDGFELGYAHDGEAGIRAALTGEYALAVFDVMMPGIDGIQALRIIRSKSRMPIIMLTAKGEDMDRITGLEGGADDYVAKPCMPRELAARIRAVLRRGAPGTDEQPEYLQAGPLVMWPSKRQAEWRGAVLELTSTEFSLLALLAQNAGHPVSKPELSERGMNRPYTRFDRVVDVHMSAIRRKLSNMDDGRSWIKTVFRQGYMLVKE